ncbi:MAG: FecR domain-containing protein [Rickettsiales bacterium]|nr:FecR domain-containing protein [Pseudomonadota bacterium]MDA0966573.1 FecR domain-containing protein [Pseudomonadota bacterium]MDG4543602.1 FecR domain-containing protein [Rickettsiales bacterium]MDG4545749.1 FecR domain-containing protein [Rickettsiales bacterium]MDG4547478.1 FecR domain-containing protein [Rickettsiales bacterium]
MFRKIIVYAFCYVLIGTNFSVAAEKIGIVGAVNENITSIDSDGNKRNMNIGDQVFFKETIKSDSTGNGQLMFMDKSALTIGPNSSVVIDEFVYNPDNSSGNLIMRGTKGTFRFIGGALSKNNAVKIKTPVGTIGIRGGIAIVDINPINGATNATFVYGDVLTFENLAGDMQSINDRGAGLSVQTPNDMPQLFRATTEQMAMQVQSLAGRPGTSGGAKIIPTDSIIDNKIKIRLEDETSSDTPEGDVEEGGEEGDDQQSDKKDKGDKKDSKVSDKRNPTKDKDSKEKQDSASGKNEKGKPTAARSGEKGTENAGKKPMTGNNTADATGRKPNPAGGTLPDDGGYMTEDGGYVDGEGKYHSSTEVKSYMDGQKGGQITLTDDGGYVDSEGNYHDATELAAYRAGQTDGTDGGYDNPNGEYHDPNGGYYTTDGTYRDPATTGGDGGTYYGDGYGGDYYGDGGYGNYYDENRDIGGYLTADGGYVDGEGIYHNANDVANYLAENGGTFDPVTGEYVGGVVDSTVNAANQNNTNNTNSLTNVTHRGLYSFVDSAGVYDEGDINAEALYDQFKLELYSLNNTNVRSGVLSSDTYTNLVPQTGYIPINYESGYSFGSSASGWKYISQNRNMYVQRLELGRLPFTNFGVGPQHNFIIGKQIGTLPTSGRQFFSFLPDNELYLSNSADLGFFDWNIIDGQLLNNTGISSPSVSSKGMLVDWGKRSFLGGQLEWGSGTLKVAYGKIFPGTSVGRLFQYEGLTGTNAGGTMNIFDDEIYGSGGVVDGFIASGDINDANLSIETPMMQSGHSYTNNYINGTNGNLPFGFMSGFIVNNNNGTLSYNRYWQQGFSFTKNADGQIDGASLSLNKISGTGPTSAYASFGKTSTSGVYSYIDDSTYALEQVNIPNGGQGVMVSGNLVSNLGCSDCKYVHWGVWAAETNVTAGTSTNVDIAHMMPYVAGTITDNVNLPNLVSATYSGSVFGNILNGSSLGGHTGAMNATIQLGNGSAATINSGDLNITGFGGYSFQNSGSIAFDTAGQVRFDSAPITGANITAGSINGALFGPSAENFGGNFKFDATGGVQGTGVYLGNQTSATP